MFLAGLRGSSLFPTSKARAARNSDRTPRSRTHANWRSVGRAQCERNAGLDNFLVSLSTSTTLTGDARLEFLRNSGPAPEMKMERAGQ